MSIRTSLVHLPERFAVGAYVLHSGLSKWNGDEQTAGFVHGMASGAYPFLGKLKPTTFLKALSALEITTGALLLIPIVPRGLAGFFLSFFSGGLVTMYLLTPALREEGSVWPNQNGLAISKDVFMLGVGATLVADGILPGKG